MPRPRGTTIGVVHIVGVIIIIIITIIALRVAAILVNRDLRSNTAAAAMQRVQSLLRLRRE